MNGEWLKKEIYEISDILVTIGFLSVALVIPGLLQMHYGISAVKITIMIVLGYLAIHLMVIHIKHVVDGR